MAYRILIIEDEPAIREVLRAYLEKEDYEVVEAADGLEGLERFRERKPHLVILDLMMPGVGGFDVLSQLRIWSEAPVLILSAKGDEIDKIKGFDLGVDDYVTKPFSPGEVLRRVAVLLRRVYAPTADREVVVHGPFTLEIGEKTLYRRDDMIDLTPAEWQLMHVFMRHPNQVLSREQLVRLAFGEAYDAYDRTIDSHVKNLRKKIEVGDEPRYLRTKYGLGYVFGEVQDAD